VTAHIDHEIAALPELVTIETAWRSPKEQRPGALQKHQYRELAEPDNPDAEPPCPSAKAAIVVFDKQVGRTVTVCLDDECPVHTNHQPRGAADPPVMTPAPEQETEEEAAQRQDEREQRMAEYQASSRAGKRSAKPSTNGSKRSMRRAAMRAMACKNVKTTEMNDQRFVAASDGTDEEARGTLGATCGA
jgi:ParB family chromosome partitioning protein